MHRMEFTGLTVDVSDLLVFRECSGPFPTSWSRATTMINGFPPVALRPLRSWLVTNALGRFGIVGQTHGRAALYFESLQDAIRFRLIDGAEAPWQQEQQLF
jgi:hypothetical protein